MTTASRGLVFSKPGIAIITGASSGIGRAAAISLYEAGWSCVLSGRRADELEKTAQQMRETQGDEGKGSARVCCVVGDLTASGEIERLFDEAVKGFGK